MANSQRGAARGAVIQGSFIGGRFMPRGATPPPIQPRTAGVFNQHSAHLQRMAQAKMAQARMVQPAVVQRHGNSQSFQLPANLSNFGGGGGQPLPGAVRQKMESFFGTSFADVRVHVGPQASAIGALAFTQGSNLYFAQGQYNPHTPQGQQILGHELTHVVQQRAGRVSNPFGSGVAVVQDRSLEAEADRMGTRAAAHEVPVQMKRVSSVRANVWNRATGPFLVQRKQTIQRKTWKWDGAGWVDGIDNEALEVGAVEFGAAPRRRGRNLQDYEYVPDLTQEQVDERAAALLRAQEEMLLARAEFERLTRLPLRSEAYVWIANRWAPANVEYGTAEHEELKKWLGYKFGGPRVPSKKGVETPAFLQWAVGANAWMGFTQNAWPCHECMTAFTNDSRHQQVKVPNTKGTQTRQVNFVFNVIGNSGGYAGDHHRSAEDGRGVVVIQGGVVTYGPPALIPMPSDAF